MAHRFVSGSATVVALALLSLSVALATAPSPAPVSTAARAERLEQAVATADRLQARDQAIAAGRFGTRQPVVREPAPGWEGERLVSGVRDDWEPAVATDPSDPYVYILTTRLGYPKPCPGNCPIPHISLHVSPDGGRRGIPRRRCAPAKARGSTTRSSMSCANTGDVYAVYLNGFNVLFLKSDDPRRDVERSGQDLWQRLVERQARDGHERRRAPHLRVVERAQRAATRGSPSRMISARRGHRRSSSTGLGTSSPTTAWCSTTAPRS